MLKLGIFFIACHLASGSVVPVVKETPRSEVPAVRERLDSPSPGFSPEQMTQLNGICFTALKLMLDQTSPLQQHINSSEPLKKEEVSPRKIIPQGFEQIGTRFFYIEKDRKMTWFKAQMTCRQMGGQLATIQDEEELNAISKNLKDESYWLDLNDLATNGLFVSWSSGKAAPFLKWHPSQTDEDLHKEHCVNLYGSYMFHEECESYYYLFICQAVGDN